MNFLLNIILAVTFLSLAEGQTWVQWSGNKGVPSFQAPRGREADYTPLYVIRANYNGDLIPGKYNGDWGTAYISYGGGEHATDQFEFFTSTNVKWIPASNGVVPEKAVVGSKTASGETLYIGRAYYKNSITPGKVHPSNGGMYIPYKGQELYFKQYEQLVYA